MLIQLDSLVKRYNINLKGILHIGAGNGEEISVYEKHIDKNRIVLIDAINWKIENIKNRYNDILIENLFISDKTDKVKYDNNTNKFIIVEQDNEAIESTILKNVIERYNFHLNFLNLNILDNEIKCIKGLYERLNDIEYIYLNVKDGNINGIDEYLRNNNFDRIVTIKRNESIINAFFIKKSSYEKKYTICRASGRLGNAIFRYFACSLYCIKNNLNYILDNDFHKNIDKYTYFPGVDQFHNNKEKINGNFSEIESFVNNKDDITCYFSDGMIKYCFDSNNFNEIDDKSQGIYVKNYLKISDNNFLNLLNKDLRDTFLFFEGYFQNDIYLSHKQDILNYMENNKHHHHVKTDRNEFILVRDIIDDISLPSSKIYDIVIHIRLGDFHGRPDFIEYIYYEKLFESINFKKKKTCLMVEKDLSKEDKKILKQFINWFNNKKIEITIESNKLMIDFNIMKQCKILICSMSSLSWCCAFLSRKIEVCYMPNYNFRKIRPETSFKKPIENTIFYEVSTTKKKHKN